MSEGCGPDKAGDRPSRAVGCGVVLATAGSVVAAVVTAGPMPYLEAGTAYPGLIQALLYGILRTAAMVAGAVALGGLVYVLSCTGPARDGRVDLAGFAGWRVVERAAAVWALCAVAMIPVSAADIAGMRVGDMVSIGALPALMDASEKPKAWIVVAVCAVVVTAVARWTLSWTGAVVPLVVAGVGVLAPVVVGNAGEGPGHDYATGAVILFQLAISVPVGLLWCTGARTPRMGGDGAAAATRTRHLVTICAGVACGSGAVLVALLIPPSAAIASGYGRIVLVGIALLATMLTVARRSSAHPVGGAAAMLAVALFALAGMRPAPAFAGRPFTAHEAFIGFDVTRPPSAWQLLTFWRFDVVLGTAAVAGAVWYVAGGSRRPVGRQQELFYEIGLRVQNRARLRQRPGPALIRRDRDRPPAAGLAATGGRGRRDRDAGRPHGCRPRRPGPRAGRPVDRRSHRPGLVTQLRDRVGRLLLATGGQTRTSKP
ncbi:hypothetical protein [Nocardia sp. NPDC060249]|uniref:hypothetical protein n=1 Tax=Nocardia sp. NPDC060249 TaxID=3347082 RepID=UPI00365822D5